MPSTQCEIVVNQDNTRHINILQPGQNREIIPFSDPKYTVVFKEIILNDWRSRKVVLAQRLIEHLKKTPFKSERIPGFYVNAIMGISELAK